MIKYLVIHHTGVSREIQKYQAWVVDSYHKQQFGMLSSLGFYGGYNYIIEPTGYCVQYRREGEDTAAVIGHNRDSLHFCMSGNFSVEMPTDKQIEVLRGFLTGKLKQYNLPLSAICNHRDLQANRNCPGDLISEDWGRNLIEPLPLPVDDQKKQDDLTAQKLTIIQQIKTLLERLMGLF